MAIQYLAIVEEATRGTDPTTGYVFPAVQGDLLPQFNPTDEARDEFRGQDSGLGNTSFSLVRRDSQWTHTIEMPFRPGPEVNLLLKHFFGFAGTRATVDTSAKKGIFYPVTLPYGEGQNLGTKAIGIVPNYDVQGVTKSKYFGGGRVTSCTISGEGTGDIMISFDLQGPGGFIGAETTATAGAAFSLLAPFIAKDVFLYITGTPARTGTAPDYTDVAAGTMALFNPDSFSITITNGLDDKVVFNQVQGPSKTNRQSQFLVEANFPIDYEDPASGFSSHDEYEKLFSGVSQQNILITASNGEIAGAVDEEYSFTLDLPSLLNKTAAATYNSEGQTPSIDMAFSGFFSTVTDYQAAIITVDQDAVV